jgi:trehalose-phosphatase
MEHLLSVWETIQDQIKTLSLLLFFDYDGTLTPIVSSPEIAFLPQETRDLLKALSKIKSCKIAIISGRTLTDVKQKISIEDIVYVGNHGLEIEGPGIKQTIVMNDSYLKTLQTIKADLQATIEGYKGAFIEDKGLALSVHFRLVELEGIIELRNKARAVLLPYSMKNMIKVRSGKMVFEIRPPVLWDKGKAALWLIDRWRAMFDDDSAVPFYCGDDRTDEDAFLALTRKGITVIVGAHDDSAAQYYLNSQEEVNILLKRILELKQQIQ